MRVSFCHYPSAYVYRYNKADDVIGASACNASHACSDTCHNRSIHISTHSAYTNL